MSPGNSDSFAGFFENGFVATCNFRFMLMSLQQCLCFCSTRSFVSSELSENISRLNTPFQMQITENETVMSSCIKMQLALRGGHTAS
jgi:hypothetical protein